MKTTQELLADERYVSAFFQAVTDFFLNWLQFKGKSTRFEFNCAYFGTTFAMIPIALIYGILGAGFTKISSILAGIWIFIGIVLFIALILVSFVGNIALWSRRLADCGFEPIFIVTLFIPLLNFLVLLVLMFKSSEPETINPGGSD